MVQVVDLKRFKKDRERGQRKLDPKRQALVQQIAQRHSAACRLAVSRFCGAEFPTLEARRACRSEIRFPPLHS